MNDTRPLIIYHGHCADGFAAAWCFWRKYHDGADYVAGVYQQLPPDVTGRYVYIVDFSYKYDVLSAMSWQAKSIVVLDHHKSAAEDLQRLPRFQVGSDVHPSASCRGAQQDCWTQNVPEIVACFDMERSGATLAWDFLYPGESRPPLLAHVEDRDLWRFALPGTREIQANLFSYPYDFELWDRLMAADQEGVNSMIQEGAAIERKHHKDIAELVKVCQRRMMIGGHDVPVASLPYTFVSDAALMMAQGEPFSGCYWDTPDGRNFGLRATDEGLDVSQIAKQYGGGGHAKAAGFKVPRNHELAQS